MALSAATHWELRGGSGSDTNGGGFAGNGSLAAPSAPALATTTGGTLTVTTWYFVVTYSYYSGAINYDGPKSAETSIVVPNTTNDAVVVTSPAASTGASHYRVWAGTTSGGPYYPHGTATGYAIGTNATITTPVASGNGPNGVDYSQQNSQQVNIDNSTITTSVTTNVITFTGYTPTAADVGNLVHIASGTNITAGFWQIMQFSSTTWTMDRNIPSSGTTTNMLAKMGGALNTFSVFQALVVAGNIVWVKAATYAETWTASVSSTVQKLISWYGYSSSRGDAPTGTSRPLIDGGSARTNCIVISGDFNIFAYFRFASSTGAAAAISGQPLLFKCKFSSAGTFGVSITAGTSTIVNCEMASCSSGAASIALSNTEQRFINCYSHDNAGGGLISGNSSSVALFLLCASDTNSGNGFSARRMIALYCTAYGNTGASSDGFSGTGNAAIVAFNGAIGCISDSNGRYGYNDGSGAGMYLLNCQSSSNATAAYSGIAQFPTINSTSPGFTDAAGGDLSIGVALKGLAVSIGTDEGMTGNGVMDLGAVQRQEPTETRPPRIQQIVGGTTPEY